MSADITRLARATQELGWQTALFEYTKTRIANGQMPYEDSRSSDWVYLLNPADRAVSLVMGCGLGEAPLALSRISSKVYAADCDKDRIAFLDLRRQQQQIENVAPVLMKKNAEPSLPAKSFDIVSVREFDWHPESPATLTGVLRHARRWLKSGGQLHLSLANRLVQPRLQPSITAFGYQGLLKKEGFSDIELYAPLPFGQRAPLFYVPLSDPGLMNCFLRDIFGLFEAASPEVKKTYALEYQLARLGVKAAPFFGLARLIKYFVPGFHVIARKKSDVGSAR